MGDKLTKEEAAKFIGVKPRTLGNWISERKGPPSYKYLGRVYFDKKDLEAFKKTLIERRDC